MKGVNRERLLRAFPAGELTDNVKRIDRENGDLMMLRLDGSWRVYRIRSRDGKEKEKT